MGKSRSQFPFRELRFRTFNRTGNQLDDGFLWGDSLTLGQKDHAVIGVAQVLLQAKPTVNYFAFELLPSLVHVVNVV
jgi:hypothetical protein